MHFDYLIPDRIIFGPGTAARVGEEAKALGKRLLLVTGRNSFQASGIAGLVLEPLRVAGMEVIPFNQVTPEPELQTVEQGLKLARSRAVDLVLGVGGGSALDVAKTTAGLYNSDKSVSAYFHGEPVTIPGLPWIAVPTTAGSGAEVTRNSVLTDASTGQKKSIRCDDWMATVVIVDPHLTMSVPRHVTASSGMDALTHALEAYTSRWSHPLTDTIALEAAVTICRKLFIAYKDGSNRDARERMALGSLMAGIALNNARAGAVHGLAHPIGCRYHIPHGVVCGILLPYVMELNIHAVEDKYARVAAALDLTTAQTSTEQAARKLYQYICALKKRVGLPEKLSAVGLRREDIPELVEASLPSGSMAANPVAVDKRDLQGILEANL